eukprot:Tamp_08618.p1 GENE.Tamp_08618~~Tamp_08618.p1  ORF type:complete len:652 (+),score=134.08 Tamp_08618:218-1957(+)
MSCGLLPRSSSLDDGSSSDEEDNLMEVDGKAVLAAQSERLKHKSNPYVGTFHYGHRASKMLTGQTGGSPPGSRKSSPPQQPQPESHAHGSVAYSPLLAAQKSPACGSHDAAASVHLVQAPPPLGEEALDVGPVQGLHRTDGACQDNCRSRKPVDRGPDPAHAPLGSPLNALNRERMKQALQLVESVPADPEMCGLQALLPRQAGVQVQYKIGEGSFGKCVKVLNRKNRQQWSKGTSKRGIERHLNEIPMEGESLVIKYIKKAVPTEDSLGPNSEADIIQREIRIHGKCSHPNVVRLFGHYQLGAKVGLILGFVEGVELHEVLHVKRKLPEDETFIIMLQILRATAYLHSINIIHRDLKPRNVLVSSRLRAHVIDLGLAIDMSDSSDAQNAAFAVVGTQGYIPPSGLRNEPATYAFDMWSLGIMLYETVCGFAPFLPHELLMPGCVVQFPDESWGIGMSAELQDLLSRMLDKEDSTRIRAQDALNHAWCEPQKVAAADAQLEAAAEEERAKGCDQVQKDFSEEVIESVKKTNGSLPSFELDAADAENQDGNQDSNGYNDAPFSYAYYRAIIVEGGRNDLM